MMAATNDHADAIVDEFRSLVNMTPHELDTWLKTDESKDVGWVREGESESVGHDSGRHIVRLLRKRTPDYTDDDRAHMHKVVAYIKRHSAQGGPHSDKQHSRWAYSLKNWGHDPFKR